MPETTLQDGLDALGEAQPIDPQALKAWHASYAQTAQPHEPVPVPPEPFPDNPTPQCELCLITARVHYLWLFQWGVTVDAPPVYFQDIAIWYVGQVNACPCGAT